MEDIRLGRERISNGGFDLITAGTVATAQLLIRGDSNRVAIIAQTIQNPCYLLYGVNDSTKYICQLNTGFQQTLLRVEDLGQMLVGDIWCYSPGSAGLVIWQTIALRKS